MSIAKSIFNNSERILRGMGKKRKTPAGTMVASNLTADMKAMTDDLNARQTREAIKAMSFILRQQTVANLRKGSSSSTIGESQKSKMTRGDWKNPKISENGVKYLAGGWSGEVLEKRGADKKTMAYNGGDTHSGRGNRGIISRTTAGRSGWMSVTGPRYGADNADDDKAGYNYAHTLEFGAAHKAWGTPAAPLPKRPFLGPAGAMSRNKQVAKLTSMMKKWGKGQ